MCDSGTIYKPTKEDYPKLVVEEGRVTFPFMDEDETKEVKEYVLGRERDQENPVTIGRESPETIGKKDILIAEEYGYTSRNHCEIFFDGNKKEYFLVDYSMNGTLVDGHKVGGNNVRATRKLEHMDLIEIPAVDKRIKMRFLTEKKGIRRWIEGKV